MALEWEFDEDTCRWAAESKHRHDRVPRKMFWLIFVLEDGSFDESESDHDLMEIASKDSELTDNSGDFATLREAKMWCQNAENVESVALELSRPIR